MKSYRKLSKICSIHGKNREISSPHNFWTTVKDNIPEVWNWNCWTFFGLEIGVWGHGPPWSPSGYAPVNQIFITTTKTMTDFICDFCGETGECISSIYVFTNFAPRTRTSSTTYTFFNRIQFRSNNIILYFPRLLLGAIGRGEKIFSTSSSL